MILRWLRRRRLKSKLIENDARDLIERFGGDAHGEAQARHHQELYSQTFSGGAEVDDYRNLGHWERVSKEIQRIERA